MLVARKSAPSEIFVFVFVFVSRKSAPFKMMILNVLLENFSFNLYTFGSFFVSVTNPWVARKFDK